MKSDPFMVEPFKQLVEMAVFHGVSHSIKIKDTSHGTSFFINNPVKDLANVNQDNENPVLESFVDRYENKLSPKYVDFFTAPACWIVRPHKLLGFCHPFI